MPKKVHKKTSFKDHIRLKHRKKIRSKLSGQSEKPRLSVYRSNKHIYVQLIDDETGKTLVAASTNEEETRGSTKKTLDGARSLGQLIAKRAMAKKIKKLVFDRSGYIFHGRIKALADAAREAGLEF